MHDLDTLRRMNTEGYVGEPATVATMLPKVMPRRIPLPASMRQDMAPYTILPKIHGHTPR